LITLMFHQVVTDQSGFILPWYSNNLGESYSRVVDLVWNYWMNLPIDSNGVEPYLQHRMVGIHTGIGGDQLAMALSSWQLLYQYSGNPAVVSNMTKIADFYLDYGFSGANTLWPNLPFPYNGDGDRPVGPGFFDQDMIAGIGYTQPDKAGSFGIELVTLYKMTGTQRYLTAAMNIADTLASKVTPGDNNNSPLPFKVNVNTGEIASAYTTNWTGTLRLNLGNTQQYSQASNTIKNWLKNYPIVTNKWGPFFEDIDGWSDTEINADTMAWYILEHPQWGEDWALRARTILNWTEQNFGNPTWNGVDWIRLGTLPINEQTAYRVPGNSHTSRHGSVELLYAEKTGDLTRKNTAIRELNWATYMVNNDGANQYPENLIWLTDGYGDYVRHYLRSMGAFPELAPDNESHLLRSTSTIKTISYGTSEMEYETYDQASLEVIKLNFGSAQ
jgi:hypothetical protein